MSDLHPWAPVVGPILAAIILLVIFWLGGRAHGRKAALIAMQPRTAAIESHYSDLLAEKHRELGSLKQQLGAREQKLGEARAKLIEAGTRLSAADDYLARLRDQQAVHEQIVARVGADLDRRADTITRMRAETVELETSYRHRIERRDAQIRELEGSVAEHERIRSGLEGRAQGAESEIGTLRESLSGVSGELQESRQTLDAAEEQLEAAHALLEQDSTRYRELSQRNQTAEQNVLRLNDEVRRRDDSLEHLSQEQKETQRAIDEVRNDLASGLAAISTLQSGIEELEGTRLRHAEGGGEEVDSLSAKSRRTYRELGDSHSVVQEPEDQLGGTESQLGQLRAAQVEQAAKLRALEVEVTHREAVIQTMRADAKDLEARFDRRLRERQLEAEHLGRMLEQREDELSRVRAQLDRSVLDLRELNDRSARRDERMSALQEQDESFVTVRDQLQRQVHERELEVRRLRAQLRCGNTEAEGDDEGNESL